MKLTLAKNSLFAILLRSHWALSLAIGAAVFLGVRVWLAVPLAVFAASPFLVISMVVLWRQVRQPGAGKVAAVLERHRAMSIEEFAAALEEAYRRQGYRAERLKGAPAELEVTREGRTQLVACKRWKAMRTGIEPLRELHAAVRLREVQGGIYVALGEVTDNARAFAAQNDLQLLQDVELARLLDFS